MPRKAKRTVDKVLSYEDEEQMAKMANQRMELEKNLQQMREAAQEKRESVLQAYLKENEGKPIKVTTPPPRKERALTLASPKGKNLGKKKAKTTGSNEAKASTSLTTTSSSEPPLSTGPSLVSMDQSQLLEYFQSEISLSPNSAAAFKKEKLDGKYLHGLWLHRNDAALKDRIDAIFMKLFPSDRDFAMFLYLLSTKLRT